MPTLACDLANLRPPLPINPLGQPYWYRPERVDLLLMFIVVNIATRPTQRVVSVGVGPGEY